MLKKIVLSVLIVFVFMVGCANSAENTVSVKDGESALNSIAEIERINSPSMDIYVENYPLVRRTINYNLEGSAPSVYKYEYDDYNRKQHVYYGYYNEDEQSIIDCYTYNYTYDENYCYEEMIYHLLDGKSAITIYDARRDEVQSEFYTSEGEFISFECFVEYRVEGNTVRRKSWVDDYEGTGWTVKKYDNEGNLTYYGHTNNVGEIESETIRTYIYDDNNRVVQEKSDYYKVNGYPSQTIRNYVYEGDLLIQETEKNILNIGSGAMNITSSETTDYCCAPLSLTFN